MILCHAISTVLIYVLQYKDPLKVVICESDPTLSDSVPSKLIYPLPFLTTHTRTKASLIMIPSASTVLEITKCFSYFTSIQAESILCFK